MAAWTRSGWPKNPRALAGRLRRAQTPLRALGIYIVFGREGRLGTRTIRIAAMGENRTNDTVSTVSRISDHGDRAGNETILRPDWNRRFNRADALTVLTQNPHYSAGARDSTDAGVFQHGQGQSKSWPKKRRPIKLHCLCFAEPGTPAFPFFLFFTPLLRKRPSLLC